MLSTILPHAVVDTPIDPHIGSETVLFIIDVVTLVSSAIFPRIQTASVHFIVSPSSFIAHSLLRIRKSTASVECIVLEFSFVDVTVAELQGTVGTFPALCEVASIFISICKGLLTVSIWLVR